MPNDGYESSDRSDRVAHPRQDLNDRNEAVRLSGKEKGGSVAAPARKISLTKV
jgi:hypothetical protein